MRGRLPTACASHCFPPRGGPRPRTRARASLPGTRSAYLQWEGNRNFTAYPSNPYHNATGPISVASPAHVDRLSSDFVKTAVTAGIR